MLDNLRGVTILVGMVQRFVIGAVMPGANQLREMNPFVYNKAKRSWGGVVGLYARKEGIRRVDGPTSFHFHFMEKDKRRDPDNIASGAFKLILDALQEIGILPNDNWAWVSGFSFTWEVSKTPGVIVTMRSE